MGYALDGCAGSRCASRVIRFLLYHGIRLGGMKPENCFIKKGLVVFAPYFIVAYWVSTDGAYLRRFFALVNVAAISTFPFGH